MRIIELLEAADRFRTGIRNTTVSNPAKFPKGAYTNLKTWEGDPDNYDFKRLKSQYDTLKNILKRNKFKFTYIGVASYSGNASYLSRTGNTANLTRFVAVSDPMIWEKYEGNTAGGGRHRSYQRWLRWPCKLNSERRSIFLTRRPPIGVSRHSSPSFRSSQCLPYTGFRFPASSLSPISRWSRSWEALSFRH